MGMLEIRRSSARLDMPGQFRMPELDNGSARAFAAQAEAAKSAAAAARVAGQATVEGISRRGQIVARTLHDLGKMAVELANRENERIATDAVLASENDRNRYMTGDGTPENPGQFNVRYGKDGQWHAEEWLSDIRKAAERRREEFTKNLNGPQRRMYDAMVARRDVDWNARIFAHAAKVTMEAEAATASAALAQAKEDAISKFDNPGMRDRAIEEMYAAKGRELDLRQVPEGLRKAEYKALTEDYLLNLAKTKFTAWQNETFGNADPDAVSAAWDEKRKELEKLDGRVPTNKLIRNHLGTDTLDDTRRELLTKKFNEARTAAIGRSYALRRENERMALEDIDLKSREARATGDLEEMEKALAEMQSTADRLAATEKGSRVHVAAVEEAVRLNAAADAEAKRLEWESIINAAASRTEYAPPKGSRMEKFHKALKASYDEQAARWTAGAFAAEDATRRAERTTTEAALRTRMLAAAKLDPGGFSAQLADAAEQGLISLDQYRKLRDEFVMTWRKEGMPEKAAALVDVLKKEFFAGKDYDLGDRLGVNPKTGKFEYGKDPDTKKPFEGEDVEFETTEVVPVRHRLTLYGSFVADNSGRTRAVTRTNTLTSDEQIQLLDMALELAQHDGEWISTDTLTGEPLERPRKLNAVQEFQNLCSSMKARKGAAAAQETIVARAEAQLKLNAAFAAVEDETVASAAKRDADEIRAREAARQMRRAPFSPKMPGSLTPRNNAPDAAENDFTEN